VRRWQFGERRVPCGVGIVFRLLADGVVTVEQVERAANPIPVRVNGGTEPFAPLPFEIQSHYAVDAAVDRAPAPVPEVTAPPAIAEPAPVNLAEPVTTAEKVAALTAMVCHWPIGDPQHSDFRFCGEATTIPPRQAEIARSPALDG
jgi:hypothetical protein